MSDRDIATFTSLTNADPDVARYFLSLGGEDVMTAVGLFLQSTELVPEFHPSSDPAPATSTADLRFFREIEETWQRARNPESEEPAPRDTATQSVGSATLRVLLEQGVLMGEDADNVRAALAGPGPEESQTPTEVPITSPFSSQATSTSVAEFSPSDICKLMDMGFSPAQAQTAHRESMGDIEKFCDLLMASRRELRPGPEESQTPTEVPIASPFSSQATSTNFEQYTPSDASVQGLIDLGFSKAQAQTALRIGQGNVQQAVDWLMARHTDSM